MRKKKVTFNGEDFTVAQCATILGVRVVDIEFRVKEKKMSLEDACAEEFTKEELRKSRLWNASKSQVDTKNEKVRNHRSKILPPEWTFDGKTMSPAEWASFLGVTPNALRYRVKQGWPLSKILSSAS